ncbi:hypothetical protein [Lichenibacterium ramalinae]|uniref:hypothetical protein n=1 Tax=Lichenibacterium ramalinae TaxID=2316527 RepID=UPI00100F9D7F|nr:hypothetical protein [Lichenibacterium ramalinae]
MEVKQAVEILTRSRPSQYLFEREFAVAVFSSWLNSPEDLHAPSKTLFVALNLALLNQRSVGVDPPREWFSVVFEPQVYLTLMRTAIDIPLFWHLDNHLEYNDCIYTGDLVRFLLTYRPKGSDKRKRPSLGKAFEFINRHGGYVRGNFSYGRTDWCSASKHHVIWRDFKRSSPFQCVRFHGSKFDWYLDPRQPGFLEQLIETASREQDILQIFCEALDVQERLRAIVDGRAMAVEDFFLFPANLSPKVCRLPAMSASSYGKMATYRRSATGAK